MNDESSPFRVLSIDGGGMRGVYAASFLDAIAKKVSARRGITGTLDIGKGFDLITGTSTGGIIGAGLAAGKTPTEIVQFYKDYGNDIFVNPMPIDSSNNFYISRLGLWGLSALRKSANGNNGLQQALNDVFGEETLADVYKRRNIALCIPSIAMNDHSCSVFKTPHHPEGKYRRDDKLRLADVCLATSAAPIVLPLAQIPDPDKEGQLSAYVDGGLCANNPVLIGLTEALLLAGDRPIEIVSIGTCPPAAGSLIHEEEGDRGLLQWRAGINTLETSMDAQAHLMTNTVQLLVARAKIPCTIIRPKPSHVPAAFHEIIGLDQPSDKAIQELINFAHIDANKALGDSAQSEQPNLRTLVNIFEGMPQMEVQ